MTYRTIVADPPWPYTTGRAVPAAVNSRGEVPGVTSVGRYGAMTIDELCGIDVPAAEASHLYLWTTNAFMVEAHRIAEAWGFTQKTILTWVKTAATEPDRPSMKMGYYFRGATEHCLFCVRGSLPLQTQDAYPTAFLWPRLPHSVKPDAFYDLVEQVSPGPYLDVFSRRARLGWDTWGDEALHGTSLP